MATLESTFREHFASWQIHLPGGAVARRERGKIVKAGWAIWYLFGTDEAGEYLDYYASHRLTEDSHVRIRADGSCEDLPSIFGLRLVSPDPEEDARWDAAHLAKNQAIGRMLEEKGFGIEGDEPDLVRINRYLRLNDVD